MKKTLLFILLALCNIGQVFSQIEDDPYYVYLYSDSIIFGKEVKYVTPVFKRAYFLVDSVKVNPGLVKFYRVESGFYANLKTISSRKNGYFAQRVEKGTINLYRKTTEIYDPGGYNYSTGMYTPGHIRFSIKEYYNRAFNDIKKATYRNLIIELADNPQSIACLKKHRKVKTVEILTKITGGALFMGGIFTAIIKDKEENKTGNYIVAGAGIACMFGGRALHNSQRSHFLNAIDVYNE